MKLAPNLLAVALLFAAFGEANAAEPIRMLRDFSLSPDGSTLLFSWSGDLWKANVDGGDATRITWHSADDREPHYSPDGSEIAFTSNRDGSYQVYTMDAAGGAPERLTFHSESYSLVQYDPSGDRLVVRAARDHFWRSSSRYFFIPRHGRSAEQLLFDAYGSAANLSADGNKVLFCREGVDTWRKGYHGSQASQIWMYDLKEGFYSEELRDEKGYRSPLWRPDGLGFYYVGQQDGSFNLYSYDRVSGTSRQLTNFDDDGVAYPTLSADGSTLVFRRLFDLYVLHPDKSAPAKKISLLNSGEPVTDETFRRTLSSASEVTFSDDGLEAAFIAGGDLWVMDTELKEPIRITSSAEDESSPVFVDDGDAILFISRQQGACDIWRVEREDSDLYWWQSHKFVFKQLTNDAAVEANLSLSPDGKQIAFLRSRGDLMTMGTAGKDMRRVVASWDGVEFDWSPDGKWFVYSEQDEDFNRDIFIIPSDASAEPFNLSMHPDNDWSPRWSPDGHYIAFTGRRSDDEIDVYYAWLRKEDAETSSRDRTLEKALTKMKKERKTKKKEEEEPSKEEAKKDDAKKDDAKKDEANEEEKKDDTKKDDAKKDDKNGLPEVVIDFDGLRDRIGRVSIPDSSERSLFWIGPAQLSFYATVGGKGGVYTVTFPTELSPKYLTSSVVSNPIRLGKAKKAGGLSGGEPALQTSNGQITKFGFSVRQELNPGDRFAAGFVEAWRQMRDDFYDERLNNRNWDEIRRKYEGVAKQSTDEAMLAELITMMLGELNGSHLGFFSRFNFSISRNPAFTDSTAHLGLRYDPTFNGPGWKVTSVIKGGPTTIAKSAVKVGEIILSVDGTPVDPSIDVTTVLNGDPERDILLRVKGTDGEERDVTVRPRSYSSIRRELYEEWIDHNRALVDEASKGTLGYLHIRGMNWSSFLRFEEELYKIGYGKDGLVIDVRANGGGSTTDHLLTALTQPRHAITLARGAKVTGYPHDRMVYATWDKPIVVLCDQNSFSNAEIFSHAIKTLGRGEVVGVTTAGGVISTGAESVMDLGTLRKPFRGWFLINDGADMEKNGAVPHHIVWPWPGDLPAGKDTQIAKGIEVLLEEVAAWKAKTRATPKYDSTR